MSNNILEELLKLPIPNTLTQDDLKLSLDQLNIFEPGTKEFSKIEKIYIDLGYKIPPNYLGVVISNWYEELIRTTKEAERPKNEAQTTPVNLEQQEQERLKRETSAREAKETAEADVKRGIEKQQEIYAKVEAEKVKLSVKEQEAYENYKEYSKQKPQQAVEELSQEIENRVSQDLKSQGLTDEEIKLASKGTATQIVENLTQIDSPEFIPQTHQTAVLAHVAKNTEAVGKEVSESANNVATAHLLQYQMYKDITGSAFGKNFADATFGIDADKVNVTTSDTPQAGSITFNPYQVFQSNQNILQEIGTKQAKDVLLKHAGGVLERRIALLTPNSAAGKLLQSVEAKSLLFSTFGVGAPIKWEATNLIGKLALKTGYAPVVSAFGKLTGINTGLTGSISTGVAKQTLGKVATNVGVKAGFGALLAKGAAAIGVSLGAFTFGVSTAITLALTAIGKMINWPKVKEWLRKNGWILGLGAVAINPWLGIGLAGAIYGLTRQLRLAAIGAGIWGFFGAIGSAFVMTVATPIIVTLLVLPPLVAFIMLVINTGAYLVPPDPKSLGLNIDNPYMLVTKVANPDTIDNPTSGKVEITYTVTITALKSTLTNLKILEATCTVSKKNASTQLPCPDGLEKIDPLPADLTVTPASSYSFTFTTEVDSSYADSSIFDSIKISADTEEKKGIITSGSESVCVGDCPHGCFVLVNNNEEWPSNYKSTLESATQELTSKFPNFVDKACSERPEVNLCYTTSDPSPIGTGGLCVGAIYGFHSHSTECDIIFNQCGLGNGSDAFFLLTHELTHHIQKFDGSIIDRYENAGAPDELPLCSYSGTNGSNNDEGSAEANALYANGGVASFSTCSMNFKQQYPKNYNFANDYMNNP